MGTAPKQQKLKPEEATEMASIVVQLDLIPKRMHLFDRGTLIAAWDGDKSCTHSVWFRDTPEVREVLRKYNIMPELK